MIKAQCLNFELVVYLEHSFLAASDISCFSCQLLLLSCIIVHASALQPGVVGWIKTLQLVVFLAAPDISSLSYQVLF